MQVVVYDHTGTGPEHREVFEGSPEHCEIYLRRAFPFLEREVIHGDLDGCLEAIDEQQNYSVEILSGEDELGKHETFLMKHLREESEKLEKMAPGYAPPPGIQRAMDLSTKFGDWHEKKHGDWAPDCQHAATVVGAALHRLGHQVKVIGGTALGDDDGGEAGTHYWLNVDGKHFDPKSHIIGVPYSDYSPTHEWTPDEAVGESVEDPDEPLAHLLGTRKARPKLPGAKKSEDHVSFDAEVNLAKEMQGLLATQDSYFDTARWMAGADEARDPAETREILLKHDGDVELAALAAYDLPFTDENLRALRGLVGSGSLAKAQAESLPTPQEITPAHPDAVQTAEEVRRAFEAGTFHYTKLNGKHSGGTMIGKDPESHHLYLLKPGSGDNSPAAGVHDESASQSRREAAFWHAADFLGLGEYMPRADLLYIDGREVAAIRTLPLTFKNLGTALKQNPALMPHCMRPYLVSGIIHKWAVMDYVLGNPDRHSQNLMVDQDGRTLRLIDHGSAMAGRTFDPAHDENSFIPYYLRAWTGIKFGQMDEAQKLRQMPTAGIEGEKALARWLRDIDPKRLAGKLQSYGIDPEPAVERLEMLKVLPGFKDQGINKLWLGVGVEQPISKSEAGSAPRYMYHGTDHSNLPGIAANGLLPMDGGWEDDHRGPAVYMASTQEGAAAWGRATLRFPVPPDTQPDPYVPDAHFTKQPVLAHTIEALQPDGSWKPLVRPRVKKSEPGTPKGPTPMKYLRRQSTRAPVTEHDKAPWPSLPEDYEHDRATGQHVVFHHGTPHQFQNFEHGHHGHNTEGIAGLSMVSEPVQRAGFFFSRSPEFAQGFANQNAAKGRVVRAHLALRQTADLDASVGDLPDHVQDRLYNMRDKWRMFDGEEGKQFVEHLKQAGYDSAHFEEIGDDGYSHLTHVVFEPHQIRQLP